MSFARSFSATFAAKVINLAIGIATSVIVVRTLGAGGKGLFSIGVLSASVVFNLANMGIGTGSGYFLGRRKVPIADLAGNWTSLSVVIGASVTILALLASPYLVPKVFPSVDKIIVMVSLLAIPFLILQYNLQMLCKADSDFRGYNLLEVLQPAVFLPVFAAIVWFFPGSRVMTAVWVYVISVIFGAVAAVIIWSMKVRLRLRWSRDLVGPAFRFGIQGHLANFLDFLNLRLDMIFINYFLGPVSVGYYSISAMIAERLWYMPDALAIVLYPRVAHGDTAEANRQTSAVSRQTLIVMILGSAGVLIFGKPVIGLLYTKAFYAAVAPLFILLPGVVGASLVRLLCADLLARGHPMLNMIAGTVSLVTNVVCNIIMIPRMGIAGAALATTVSHLVRFAFILAMYTRVTGVAPASLLRPGTSDMKRAIRGVRELLSRRGGGADGDGTPGGGQRGPGK